MAAPSNSTKEAYGQVSLTAAVSLAAASQKLPSVASQLPMTFEALSLFNGLVIYETIIDFMPVSFSILLQRA